MAGFILAIDQGTTSSRAIVFNEDMDICGMGQTEFPQHFPKSGWVEHDPEDLWQSTLEVCRQALAAAGLAASDIAAIGITNQRETAIIWDRETGEPIYNAIVWQDRRTAELCENLRSVGHEVAFRQKTGLLLDPYFSGTKVAWMLGTVEGARARAQAGELAFGTVDSWLIWKLTNGQRHVTDATNACRTLLFNIHTLSWDEELCSILGVPMEILPEVMDSAADFGTAAAEHLGAPLPICGVAGDQQAATVGQACFEPGMVKSTYGTGCFALINTGSEPFLSNNRLLTTIAYQLDGKPTYALEGSIFVAGAAVQWLRDGLGLIEKASDSQRLAEEAEGRDPIYLVPAFVGLGAPYWDPDARGSIFGLTRDTGPADFARATLESVGYQTSDLAEAMLADWGGHAGANTVLRVDGGMTASDWTLQFLADILAAPVDRPVVLETTALGAAWLAGHFAGVWPGMEEFSRHWRLEKRFDPKMDPDMRKRLLKGWSEAVSRTRGSIL